MRLVAIALAVFLLAGCATMNHNHDEPAEEPRDITYHDFVCEYMTNLCFDDEDSSAIGIERDITLWRI